MLEKVLQSKLKKQTKSKQLHNVIIGQWNLARYLAAFSLAYSTFYFLYLMFNFIFYILNIFLRLDEIFRIT